MPKGTIKLYYMQELVDTRSFNCAKMRRGIIEEWYRIYRLNEKHGCYMEISLCTHVRLPVLINIDTNETYLNIKEAAVKNGIKQIKLWRALNSDKINTTSIRFIDKRKFEKTGAAYAVLNNYSHVIRNHIYIN